MARYFGWWMLAVTVALPASAGGADPATPISPAKDLAAAVAHAKARGFPPAPAEDQPAFAPTDLDRGRGFAVFCRNVNLRVYPHALPGAEERTLALTAYGARNETVSAQFAIRTLAPLERVTVEASALTGPKGAVISADRIGCRWVEYHPIQSGRRRREPREEAEGREREEGGQGRRRRRRWEPIGEVVPLRIRTQPAAGLNLPAGWTQAWWLTVHLPAGGAPGRYEGHLDIRVDGKRRLAFPVVLTVLPVTLSEPRSMFFGAFLQVSGRPDGPRVHNVAQLKDLADRGIHGILWFWGHYGLDVRRVGDKLKMDFTRLDRYMDRVVKAGLKGPVVLALGNDSRGHLEQRIGELWKLPLRWTTETPETASERLFCVRTLPDPQMDALYVEAIRQLLDHAKAKGWPEIVLLPYDEPTERLKPEFIHQSALLKKHFPKTRIYGVVMGDEQALPWLAPNADILVTNGRKSGVRTYAREHGKAFWTYGGRVQASQPFGRARHAYGLTPWLYRSQGHWFWAYNWYRGDPMDEFDAGSDAQWAVAYPPERPGEACVPSPAFEGMRAGVDDVRYVEAFEALLDRVPRREAQAYRERLDALRASMADRRSQRADARPLTEPNVPFPTGPTAPADALRLAVIEMILSVQARRAGP